MSDEACRFCDWPRHGHDASAARNTPSPNAANAYSLAARSARLGVRRVYLAWAFFVTKDSLLFYDLLKFWQAVRNQIWEQV
jgi:hypothetical protein